MCGITGLLHFDSFRQVERELLKKMTDAVIHRGPDAEGYYINNNIGLGHRRLSIIDLDTGHQPMFSTDKNLVVVFNGEIYNYIELRKELESLGHQFNTDSDTEVILNAYREWNIDCLHKFNGMWAFAIWDINKKELFVSRDRIGEKPLHYSIYDNTFVFASEIKSLFEYGCPKEVNEEIMDIYLTLGYVPAPYSFYKNISKLLPGHYAIIKNNELKVSKYWDLPEIDENNMLSDEIKIQETFVSLLKDSVRLRMRSDVPYGAFLSGGLDSSSIVSLLAAKSAAKVNSFTIGYDEKAFDETKLANMVALKFNTEHYEKIVRPDNFEEALAKAIKHFDEPFGDSSAIPTGYIAEFARQKVKMVFTGDGGDEVLSGYTTYQGEKFTSQYLRLHSSLRLMLDGCARIPIHFFKGKPRYKFNRIKNIITSASLNFNDRLISKIAWIERPLIKKLIKSNRNAIQVEDYISDLMTKCPYKDSFYKLMYFHHKVSLPDDMLVKVDRMTMAHSLEARVPFLDHRLIEFMATVSKNIKMKGYERKSVLRRTIAKQLPKPLLTAPKKGFEVPLTEWFREDKVHQNALYKNQLGLDTGVVKKIIEDNRLQKQDYGNFIWMMIILNRTIFHDS